MNRTRKIINLQAFASGDNNNPNIKQYQMEFKKLIQAVFKAQSYFADFFGGEIEAMDGVQENETAFYVKTSDIPVVVGTYSKDSNTAMGTGTGKSSRFGNRTEVIYTNTPVNYSWGWSFHEGIDRATVNNNFDDAVADRLDLQAQAKTREFNKRHSSFISTSAGKTIASGQAKITKDNVADVFAQLDAYFTDIEAVGTRIATVNSTVWNAIIDSGLTTTSKGSSVNVDKNIIEDFKSFTIKKAPSGYFQTNEVIYAYIAGVGKAFTGINTARTIESEDFDGVALQGLGKAGEYISNDNKKAVAKVTVTGA